MEIVFILVEPAAPENIGAAARAVKTMGFSQFRLVNPGEYLSAPARWLAHGSNEILENASVFPSLEEAVNDIDFVIGTTAKQRSVKNDYHHVSSLPQILKEKGTTVGKAGIVFGREDSGLRNEELKRCDMVTTIPLKTTYPSLNLAQAVMVYAWELSKLNLKETTGEEADKEEGLRILIEKAEAILLDIGFKKESAIYPRILERMMLLKEGDIHLLHSVCNKITKSEK